jgi:arylformamidase
MNAEQLEQAYNPSSMIGGNYQPYIEQYILQSEAARDENLVTEDISIGDDTGLSLDLYHRAGASAPLHLFIHGGYWQELSSKESAVMVNPLLNLGINVAVLNYTLAPAASLDQMIKQCHDALDYIVTNGKSLGVDPANISISGHSAGAQLLMMMLHQFQDAAVISKIRLAVLLSGIYDLEPICHTSINDSLNLSVAQAKQLSPMHCETAELPPIMVAVAEHDTKEFRRQARDYHSKLVAQGQSPRFLELSGLNHFDIILELENRGAGILGEIKSAHDNSGH